MITDSYILNKNKRVPVKMKIATKTRHQKHPISDISIQLFTFMKDMKSFNLLLLKTTDNSLDFLKIRNSFMNQQTLKHFLSMSFLFLTLSSVHATVTDSKLATVSPIINNSCLACHSSPSNTKLNYSTTLSWINSTLIVPGKSANSRLLTVLTTNTPKAMASVKLSEKDLTALKLWIDQIKVSCPVTNSKIDYANGDGCSCPSGFDDIRTAAGALTECRKQVVITCTANFSQINTSMPDGCGCVTGYEEKRNPANKLISCSAPTFTFDVELKRYNRCYAQFTRSTIPYNDSRVALIKNKKMTGVQACMDLLKKAALNSSGLIKTNSSGDSDLEGMQILSTFQKFHMSWFSNHNWADAASDLNAFYRGTYDLFYSGEPALLMTNALFNTKVPYSTVVTSENALEAIRSNPNNSVYSRSAFSKYEHFGPAQERLAWSPSERIEVGNIIGIRPMNSDEVPYIFDVKQSNVEYKLPSGGGVLGSNPFFMLNQGHGLRAKTNGGAATYRRWSKYVYKDVLCREIPVIRSSDVAFLRQKMPASNLTFRNGNSCLQCHFSIDGLAGAVRNKSVLRTGTDLQNGILTNVHSVLTYNYPATESPETNLEKSDSDLNFYKRPATANLVFRTFEGAFINKQYTGTEEVGQAISELDDLYVCAASRYYRFLTGVNVEIRDYNDPMSPVTDSTDEIQYRDLVIKLGKNLKKHQSLNKLIEEIIASPLYITPGKIN